MNELLKKLNYKKGIVQILNAPLEFKPFIEAWKTECKVESSVPTGPADFLIFFTESGAEASRLAAIDEDWSALRFARN
jgi:hypothetical protein